MESGSYFWNAGMFVWKTANILKEIEKYLPQHAVMSQELARIKDGPDWNKKAMELFKPLEKISIDFGIMEKLSNIAAVESEFDWNDVGGWLALEKLLEKDGHGNIISGNCVTENADNNIIIVKNYTRPVIINGISNSVIVSSEAGLLICSKNRIERIKNLVNNVFE